MLSSKAKYGLKALIYLARHEGQGPCLIAEVARVERIPRKFLDTILLDLKRKGLLRSKKGKDGGYHLALKASDISAGEVVRLLDGPLAPVSCVSRSSCRSCGDCPEENACSVRGIMGDVRSAIAAILDNTSLADIAAKQEPAEFILTYDI